MRFLHGVDAARPLGPERRVAFEHHLPSTHVLVALENAASIASMILTTEALITDFRINAPHLRASVVMPGHIGTSIAGRRSRCLPVRDCIPEMQS